MTTAPEDVGAFKDNDFKKCTDSAFCKRLRGQKGEVYEVQPSSVKIDGSQLTASLVNEANQATFQLALTAYKGTVRLNVNEAPDKNRFQVPSVLQPTLPKQEVAWGKQTKQSGSIALSLSDSVSVTLAFKPFALHVTVDGKPAIDFNGNQMFAFEHLREKKEGDPEGWWEETFKSHADSKPKGPEAISFDLSFPGTSHVYGLPEHATGLSLKPTTGVEGEQHEPYRLYNLDVFEYLAESNFGLYGAVPVMQAHRAGLSVGAFWLNAAEMYVDVSKPAGGVSTQWIAESGVLDLFLMVGPTPGAVAAQYAAITGGTAMPQLFSLGYHQCRWNYNDEADTLAVDAGFDEHDIPYDVIWLDIEHTDGKRYLTWDSKAFPHPEAMQDNIASRGRKIVTIVDPHIKRDANYPVFKTAEDKGYYVKDKDGKDYDGWCWPGSSSYLDVVNPQVREWWSTNFLPGHYPGATKHLYVWNDMNEPSVFNGPEITFPKDLVHHGGVEHRDVHNVFGKLYHEATAAGLVARGAKEYAPHGDRAFVLSRAFFAGTQTVGPIWTGDNTADWDHLAVSVPMVLTINLAGIAFSGADVGGFFGNPDAELITRWYQLGAYYPFFRGHAHLETARREPWLFGEPTTTRIRNAIRGRYALLPYIYTLFRHAHLTGQPVWRPLWFEFPEAEEAFATEDQFLLGRGVLVAPVLQQGASTRSLLLPAPATWYHAKTGASVAAGKHEVAVTMEDIPSYLRGGHIVPRRERARRSTAAMHTDPITLVVALDSNGAADGELFLDDGSSFAYEKGAFLHRRFRYKDGVLISTAYEGAGSEVAASGDAFKTEVKVERIVVLGLPGGPKGWQVAVVGGSALEAASDAAGHALVVKQPALAVAADWSVQLTPAAATA
eukprot:CAMPEP_0206145352 /NCGR_PEP_ID=MMETSP1473-20131121/27104_1 /ASSEMBLY_ACC=CAM_ASM_001109 /TAXON_ID=1461547 /ORGANISM="Stichococcus sp, Strain RCC1054" /LENGTH=887 /DNA_ID=CAMNT_0053541521 /DNA_START=68 /DNA_END=2731 /DNA_ORIENTATION=-